MAVVWDRVGVGRVFEEGVRENPPSFGHPGPLQNNRLHQVAIDMHVLRDEGSHSADRCIRYVPNEYVELAVHKAWGGLLVH